MKLRCLKGKSRKILNRTALLVIIALLSGIFPEAPESLVLAAPGDTQQEIDQRERDKANLENQQ